MSCNHLGIVDPDPRIHLSVIVDPDPHLEKVDPGPKWIRIRIRVPIFHIFHKEIHVGQITTLFVTAKIIFVTAKI